MESKGWPRLTHVLPTFPLCFEIRRRYTKIPGFQTTRFCPPFPTWFVCCQSTVRLVRAQVTTFPAVLKGPTPVFMVQRNPHKNISAFHCLKSEVSQKFAAKGGKTCRQQTQAVFRRQVHMFASSPTRRTWTLGGSLHHHRSRPSPNPWCHGWSDAVCFGQVAVGRVESVEMLDFVGSCQQKIQVTNLDQQKYGELFTIMIWHDGGRWLVISDFSLPGEGLKVSGPCRTQGFSRARRLFGSPQLHKVQSTQTPRSQGPRV